MLFGNLLEQYITAVVEAAARNQWTHVQAMGRDGIQEMLEESEVQSAEQAVRKFKDREECIRDKQLMIAHQNTLLMAYFFNAHGIGELLAACEAPQNNGKIRDLLFDEMNAARARVTDRSSALNEYCEAIARICTATAKLVSPADETGDVLHEVVYFLERRIIVSLHYAFDLSEKATEDKLVQVWAKRKQSS